ncbi:SGNH/GDSL hydrolase family protein [Sporosarcina sp. Marseille-Q4943]|uniref:SGNH/GDSL hydrolase family protein n=1 Tax=Sporosarcina sp. Marseille-Q4943 TaxID=2942204 RepID=UPI00208DC0DD|nr:SGNH/GDSL hydrolase family protein [Sporosarcina sp. Marseille-Q4943]
MIARKIAVAIFILVCLAALLFSYNSWKQKLAGTSSDETVVEAPSGIAATDGEQGVPADKERPTTRDDGRLKDSELATLSANLDGRMAGLLDSRFQAGEHVKLLIVGSQAIEQGGNGGAAGLLADSLADAYKGFIETDIISFAGTSREFIEQMDELVDFGVYDVVLFEPFTLNNNGRVVIEDEHRHILRGRDALQEVKEDAVLLLMPSQPIFRPNFYLTQIRSLENFAAVRGIPYVDHWAAWPDVADDAILNYLDEDSGPNDAGAEAWGSVLVDYFTGSGE